VEDGYNVERYFDALADEHTTCDRCVEPLCVKYCPKRDVLRAFLDLDKEGQNI